MKQLDYGRLLATGWANQFEPDQLEAIEMGVHDGLDIGYYAKPEYTSTIMWIVYGALVGDGADIHDVTKYLEMDYPIDKLGVILEGMTHEVDVSWYDDKRFAANQMSQLLSYLVGGKDVSKIANPEITVARMRAIMEGRPVDHLPETNQAPQVVEEYRRLMETDWTRLFGPWQIEEIQKGLDAGIDVSRYANPEFDKRQMEEIRLGLQNGVDVTIYASSFFLGYQMDVIRQGLEAGVDVAVYAKTEFNHLQMAQIMWGLRKGLDASVYARPEYSHRQMFEIRCGMRSRVDVSHYANPEFDDMQMEQIRMGLEAGLDVSTYAKPELCSQEMHEIRQQLEKR